MASSNPAEPQKKHAQFQIFKRNVLTDVECLVEGHAFRTHRALLVFFSPYLKKKLINAEGRPTSTRVYIPKIGVNEFEVMLRYMYNGILEVGCNNFSDVYTAATVLEMQDVKSECLQLIDGKNEIRTYFYAYILSKKLGLQQNWQKALKLITHRFEEAVFSKDFMQLDLVYAVEVLSSQSLGARSEITVFLAALNWLNHDFGSRGVNAVTVLECVRFSSMTMEEIVACYYPPFLPQVVQIPAMTMILLRATCYIAAKSQGQESLFKQYASPKREFAFEGLPTELWSTSKSPTPVETDIQRQDFNKLPKHSDSVKQWNTTQSHPECSRCPEEFDIRNTKPKYVDSKMESSQEGYNDSVSDDRMAGMLGLPRKIYNDSSALRGDLTLKDQPFFHDCEDELDSDNESYSFNREDIARKLGLTEKDEMRHKKLENNAYEDRKTMPSKVHYQNTTDGPSEIQYFIPENTKIIHLIKGPLKDGINPPKPEPNLQTKSNIEPNNMKVEHSNSLRNNQSIDHDNPSLVKDRESNAHSQRGVLIDDRKENQQNVSQSSDKGTSSKGDIKDSCILVVGGLDPTNLKKESGEAVLILNDETNEWMHYSNIPEGRHNHCAACLDNNLYVVGGCNPQETIEKNRYIAKRSCFKLNLKNSKWSTMSYMNCARFDHAMVVFDGQLLVIGGQDETERFLESIEIYDPKRNRWELLNASDNMCCGRKAMGATVYRECIWVAGGLLQSDKEDRWKAVSYVDCFDPREKKWHRSLYHLPHPRCFCSLIEWEGKLHCLGGLIPTNDDKVCPTDEVLILEKENGIWTKGPSLPVPRVGGLAVIYWNSLYFLGGFNDSVDSASDVRNVSVLKPGASSWISGPSVSCHLFGLSAASF